MKNIYLILCLALFTPRTVDAVYGDSCSGPGDCTYAYSACSTTCGCTANYQDNGSGGCTATQTGMACADDADCAGYANGSCVSFSCGCATGYKGNGLNGCTANGLGDVCTVNADCSTTIAKSECNSVFVCACTSASKLSGTICVDKTFGDSCTAPGDCPYSYSICNGMCSCQELYQPTRSGGCIAAQTGLTCANDDDCAGYANLVCATTTCECATGYKDDGSNRCTAYVLGDVCTADTDCSTTIANSECASTVCACPSAFKSSGGACVAKSIGDPCSDNAHCPYSNSTCTNSYCGCASGFKDNGYGSCIVKVLGDTCTSNNDCSTISNSKCDTTSNPNLCACADAYKVDSGSCIGKVSEPVTCPEDIDDFSVTWAETLAGRTVNLANCPPDFIGYMSRYCSESGIWSQRRNHCLRQEINDVQQQLDSVINATSDVLNEVVSKVLETLAVVTNTSSTTKLNDGEIEIVAEFLDTISEITRQSTVTKTQTENFLTTASNLLDSTNVQSWNIIKATEQKGSENVLRSTERFTSTFASNVERENIMRKNLVVEIKTKSNPDDDIWFPELADEQRSTTTFFFLSAEAVQEQNAKVTAILFKNPESVTTTLDGNGAENDDDTDISINAQILSLSLFPNPSRLNPRLQLTFRHFNDSLRNPRCTFLEFAQYAGKAQWSTDGCFLVTSTLDTSVCECDHLTNFAILMSPFVKEHLISAPIRVISITGISISTLCLIVTISAHLWVWRYMKSNRTNLLLCLCTSLILGYVLFLAGVDRVESKTACTIIAALLQYIYLVIFSLMLSQGIEMAITVRYVFSKQSRIKLYLCASLLIPAVVVGVSVAAVKTDGYGTKTFCWLSVESGVIWSFVGPALVVILMNVLSLILVMKAMYGTKAMAEKANMDKVKSGVRCLCILIPTMGLTWVVGLFNVQSTSGWMPYVFAVCNGLQGFTIFVFHCAFNKQLRNAWKQHGRRKSPISWKKYDKKNEPSDSKSKGTLPEALEQTGQ